MLLCGYMNAATEPVFISLRYAMEYITRHPHEPIIYSRDKFLKLNEIPNQCLFKAGSAEIKKTQEYSKFLHKYCNTYHADISLTGSLLPQRLAYSMTQYRRVCQETVQDIPNQFQFRNKSNVHRYVR